MHPLSLPVRAQPARPLRVFAFTSGKGGVGKTNLTVNLAVSWARAGRQVLVVDGDLGLANVDILLDEAPTHSLRDVLAGTHRASDVLLRSAYGPTLLPGASGTATMADLDAAQRMALITALDGLEEEAATRFDTVLVDTGAGIGRNALFFAAAAEEVCVVTTPEPTALADAYAAIKSLVRQCGVRHVALVVNQAAQAADARDVYQRLSSVCGRFLPVVLELAGWVPADPHVHEAVMVQRPVVVQYPTAPASRAIVELSDRLLMRTAPRQASGRLQFFWRRLLGAEDSP